MGSQNNSNNHISNEQTETAGNKYFQNDLLKEIHREDVKWDVGLNTAAEE